MLIATFGPSTGWAGKTVTREGEYFILEDHGPITAVDVMEYDRHGHLIWASDGMRAWVGSQVKGAQQSDSVPGAQAASSVTSRADLAMAAQGDQKMRPARAYSKRWLLLAALGLVIVMMIAAIAVPRLFGNPWKTQSSGTTQNLYEVVFADDSHGWVSGGPSLTTSNGGKSWGASGSKVWGMSFIDARRGWGLHGTGEALVVVATTNGGEAWTQPGSQTIDFLPSALAFADEMHGWIVGMDGSILATRDGGVTWTSQTSGTTGSLEDVDFVDPVHGWAAGDLTADAESALSDAGVMLATQDGGTTWTMQDTGSRATLNAVTFADASRGWAVGFDYLEDTSVILDTRDGGGTWNAQYVGSMGQELTDIAFGDPDHGYAVGSEDEKRGVVYATSDGGATWVEQKIPESPVLYSVSCFGADHAWVVGDRGTILTR
jgi:photosystem II stability/assembly factor-like uncharacterized protein